MGEATAVGKGSLGRGDGNRVGGRAARNVAVMMAAKTTVRLRILCFNWLAADDNQRYGGVFFQFSNFRESH